MSAAPTFKFLVRVLYLSMLLFIPRLYFSRVERILRNVQMSMEDMERMVVVGLGKWSRKRWNSSGRILVYIHNDPMYPAFMQFSSLWVFFHKLPDGGVENFQYRVCLSYCQRMRYSLL
jgi:hypothetical protein